MITRRDFLKITGGSTVAWYVASQSGWIQRAVGSIPGGSPRSALITKFVTPLLIPPVMPRAGTIARPANDRLLRDLDAADLAADPAADLPPRPSGVRRGPGRERTRLLIHHAPSLTIEAGWNRPVRVKWINDLKEGRQLPATPPPVDPTLHRGEPAGRDGGPRHAADVRVDARPYTGPVPIVTHLHGSSGVGDESDGYAEAWFLPAADDIPEGFATEGTWFEFFAGKASSKYGVSWGPGFATFQYPNDQRASTLWYHDHTLGMTRLNVYAGPAGFFIIREAPKGQAVVDDRTGTTAVLPGPAPREVTSSLRTRNTGRSTRSGSLVPRERLALLPGHAGVLRRHRGPYIPFTDVSPIWNRSFREHDRGERPDLAVPHGRAATVPLPVPQRMPVTLRSSTSPTSLGSRPGRSGTRRVPRGARESDRRPREPPLMGLAERRT